MRLGLVGSVSNEAPYLIEWIAHHRVLGFETALIYHNACVDGTDTLLAALDAASIVQARPNDPPGHGPRLDKLPPIKRALRRAQRDPVTAACDYVLLADVDEFLILPQNETPVELLTRLDHPGAVSFPWRIFGSNGALTFDPTPVADRFLKAARADDPGPEIRPFWQIKTLFRPDLAQIWRQHAPELVEGETWISADGRPLKALLNGSHVLPNPDFAKGCLHHYHVKSQAEFFVKLLRGYGDQPANGGFRPGLAALPLLNASDVPCPMPEPLRTARQTEADRIRALPGVATAEQAALHRFGQLIDIARAEIGTNPTAWVAQFFRNSTERTTYVQRLLSKITD